MKIPWQSLSSDTLTALIEEFVTRDGTDYGVQEVALESRVKRVKRLLEEGKAYISYDEASESCTILDQNPS